MSCVSGRYAQASDFVNFWCVANILRGKHTGANGAATLTDANMDFVTRGVKTGDYIRNDTDGSTAQIAGVTQTTIAGALIGGTGNVWDAGDSYSIIYMDYYEALQVEFFLDIAASDINIARQSSGQCDCNVSPAGLAYLLKLNVIEAAVIHNCPCGSASARWTDAMKQSWLRWIQDQLKMITEGTIELCDGETGKDFPAIGWAEANYGKFSEAEILWNRFLRGELQ